MKLEIDDKWFNEEELKNTSRRFKGFLKEWLEDSGKFEFTTFKNPGYDEIVIWSGYDLFSMCSHHLLPIIIQEIHIGYIPNDRVAGLSKIPRAVNYFAHRPQIQERMTQQIVDYLEEQLKPKGVICTVKARHLCMEARGVREKGSTMTTSAVKGCFLKPEPGKSPKQEFFELIKSAR